MRAVTAAVVAQDDAARAREEGGHLPRPGRLHPRPVRFHRRPRHHRRRPHPRHHLGPHPQWADRLFQAHDTGTTEQQLQRIAADGLAEMYVRADNTRANCLGVEFTDVEQVDIEL